MGNCCGGDSEDEAAAIARRRRFEEEYEAEQNADGGLTLEQRAFSSAHLQAGGGASRPQHHEASSVCSSVPPSPPRMQSQGRESSPIRVSNASLTVQLEPLEIGMPTSSASIGAPSTSSNLHLLDQPNSVSNQHQQQHNSQSRGLNQQHQQHGSPHTVSSPGGDPNAAPRFLVHVNGAKSHAVARTIFEQWCIYLNHLQQSDDAALLDALENGHDASDGFGAAAAAAAGTGHHHHHLRPIGGTANFGEADVAQSGNSTRVESWATHAAQEAVSHESVEELAKDFMAYLKQDLRNRGFGGEFEYSLAGYDVTGVLTVTISVVRQVGDPHTLTLVANYHAISLL